MSQALSGSLRGPGSPFNDPNKNCFIRGRGPLFTTPRMGVHKAGARMCFLLPTLNGEKSYECFYMMVCVCVYFLIDFFIIYQILFDSFYKFFILFC